MQFKTLNSLYEFGETGFRRVEGKNPTLLPVPDGEWMDYREASLIGGRLYIEWGDGPVDAITTSRGEWVDGSLD